MSVDPLGLIGSGGAGGINPIQPVPRTTPAGGQAQDPNAPSFKDVLMENLKSVNRLQQDATKAIEDLHTGKRDDLESVLLATQKADTAFRMLLATRNKVLDAWEELKQIRV
jgi:flagellar hook-basal body complex protein FliE